MVAYTVETCCFAETPAVNKILFYLSYPIHATIGRPSYATSITDEMYEACHGSAFYLYDPRPVNEALRALRAE